MTPPTLSKGARWEYRLHRSLFASGWYVRRNVDLHERVRGSPQTLAEVDVLGLAFDVGLRPVSLIGECKDRKGSTKEADRVVWLIGIGQLVPAEHLLFAKPRIARATFQFARSTSVALWDEATVIDVEHRTGISDDAFGAFDPAIGEEVRAATTRDSLGDARLREAYDWIRGAFWYQASPGRVRQLETYFQTVHSHAAQGSPARTILFANGLLALMASALITGGQLLRASPQVSRAAHSELLASGSARAAALRDIAARADDYYRDVLERYAESLTEKKTPIDVPRLADHVAQPPQWGPAYMSFAERLPAGRRLLPIFCASPNSNCWSGTSRVAIRHPRKNGWFGPTMGGYVVP